MDIVLWVLGLVAALSIALWQNSRATSAERRNDDFLSSIPRQVVAELQKIGHVPPAREGTQPERELRVGIGFSASSADLDGDGRDELLVQFPVGAHGSALQVFGFRDDRFQLLGETSVGTPEGFTVEDFDHDGRLEICARETDWSLDLPYAFSLREKVYYRLTHSGLSELTRIKDYSPQDVIAARRSVGRDV